MTSKKQHCKQKGKFPNQFIDLDLNKKQIGFFFFIESITIELC